MRREAETALGVAITAGDAATLSSANGYTDAEKTRALAAEALKANLAGGNIFTTGSQALAASTTAYPTMNIPVNGAAPSTLTLGDVFTTSTDTHLQFQDSSNTTQALAFLSDVTNNNSSLLGANNNFTGTNTFSLPIAGTITGNITETQVTNLGADLTNLTNSVSAESAARIAGDAAAVTTANGYTDAQVLIETNRATAAEALKANLSGANIFLGGKQTLAASASGFASLNIPGTGVLPTTLAPGDLWLLTGDTHLQFRDANNATQKIAFLSDIVSTLTAGTGISITGNAINNTGVLSFNTRTGAVVPVANDYSFSMISGTVASAQLSGTYGISITGNAATATSANSAVTVTGNVPGAQITGNISGNAANVTGTVAVANGGTGVATAAQNTVFAGPPAQQALRRSARLLQATFQSPSELAPSATSQAATAALDWAPRTARRASSTT